MIDAIKIRQGRRLLRHVALPAALLGVSVGAGAFFNGLVLPALSQQLSRTGSHAHRLADAELMAVESIASPGHAQAVAPQRPAHPTQKPAATLMTSPEAILPQVGLEPAPQASASESQPEAQAMQTNQGVITVQGQAAPQTTITQPSAQSEVRIAQQPQVDDGLSRLAPGERIFNGRRIRPARTITMVTTAYSPDERSCGLSADGITASGKSVWTNGMKMVAADTRLLPFGTLVSIPGYYNEQPVPVLDRGGAIKGHRLDLLYPTHEIALQWGRKKQTVTIWEYVD